MPTGRMGDGGDHGDQHYRLKKVGPVHSSQLCAMLP